ncbi:hypothetical protein XENOCAPTIV_021977 [Xenoophorus captivus]|uniref:Uncharacterized protein n=1 Tax=Xenoophorus captivus TaxID=1517983 RepID=A0ABV0RUN1_9TELE
MIAKVTDVCCCLQVPTLLNLEEKWQSVYKHLDAAPSGNMGQIFLTYASGAGVFAHPRAVAKGINPQLYEYLQAKTNQNQRFGIICMDFPAAPMIQMIIDFQLKEKYIGGQNISLFSMFIGQTDTFIIISCGTMHMDHCPVQPNVPVYLIVLGATSLLSLIFTYSSRGYQDGAVNGMDTVRIPISLLPHEDQSAIYQKQLKAQRKLEAAEHASQAAVEEDAVSDADQAHDGEDSLTSPGHTQQGSTPPPSENSDKK